MKDPVLCVEDGHTYERVAVEQWFATGARTSPATSAQLESTAPAPNHHATTGEGEEGVSGEGAKGLTDQWQAR